MIDVRSGRMVSERNAKAAPCTDNDVRSSAYYSKARGLAGTIAEVPRLAPGCNLRCYIDLLP